MIQDLHDAFRLMAAGYPGGMAALAQRLGVSYEVLRKKVARAPGFSLSVDAVCLASQLCVEAESENCRAVVNAFAANCGGFVKLEVREQPANLMGATVDHVRSSSELLSHVTAARADGQISDNERKQIERDVTQSIAHLQAVLAEVQRENEAAHLRAVG